MVELIVPGMSCGPCARAVTNAVQSVDASATVDIDLTTKIVTIVSGGDLEHIKSAIEDAGYKVGGQATAAVQTDSLELTSGGGENIADRIE